MSGASLARILVLLVVAHGVGFGLAALLVQI